MPDYVAKLNKEIDRKISKAISKAARTSGLAQSSINGSGLKIYDQDGNYLTSVVRRTEDGSYGVGYNIDSTVIRDGGIETPSLAANSVTADKLEAALVLASMIIAGDPAGAAAIMDQNGFRTTALADDGSQYTSTRLGSAHGDSLEIIADPDLPPVASISTAGDGSFATVASQGDITVGGQPLMGRLLDPESESTGLLENLSGAIQGQWDFRNLSTFSATIAETTTMLGQFDVILQPNRSYELRLPWRAGLTINTGTPVQLSGSVRAYATFSTDGTEPDDPIVDPSELIGDYSIRAPAEASVGQSGLLVVNMATPPCDDVIRAKVGIAATAGTGTRFVPSTYGNNTWVAVVTDVGPNQPTIMAAEPGQGSAQKFTTTWVANNSRSWSASGGVYVIDGSSTKFIRQGNSGATVWHGAFSCGATATAGADAGKTIAQALAGGSTILKAEVWVQISWSEDSIGQVELRPLGANSVPSTMSSPLTSGNIVKKDYPARQSGAWIDVPTTWFTASNNGCIIASPDWLFPNTNCQFAGAGHPTASWRPKVRLTYTR